jgi:hypothetical protein
MRTLLAIGLLCLFALAATAQESLSDRVAKLEARMDNIGTKLDKILLSLQAPSRVAPISAPAPASCGPQGCAPASPQGNYVDDGSADSGRRQPVRKIVQRLRNRRGGC